MKGFCDCGNIMDEVEFSQYGTCTQCYLIEDAYHRGYDVGYSDALFDYNVDENDGDWDFPDGYYDMADDYD